MSRGQLRESHQIAWGKRKKTKHWFHLLNVTQKCFFFFLRRRRRQKPENGVKLILSVFLTSPPPPHPPFSSVSSHCARLGSSSSLSQSYAISRRRRPNGHSLRRRNQRASNVSERPPNLGGREADATTNQSAWKQPPRRCKTAGRFFISTTQPKSHRLPRHLPSEAANPDVMSSWQQGSHAANGRSRLLSRAWLKAVFVVPVRHIESFACSGAKTHQSPVAPHVQSGEQRGHYWNI